MFVPVLNKFPHSVPEKSDTQEWDGHLVIVPKKQKNTDRWKNRNHNVLAIAAASAETYKHEPLILRMRYHGSSVLDIVKCIL